MNTVDLYETQTPEFSSMTLHYLYWKKATKHKIILNKIKVQQQEKNKPILQPVFNDDLGDPVPDSQKTIYLLLSLSVRLPSVIFSIYYEILHLPYCQLYKFLQTTFFYVTFDLTRLDALYVITHANHSHSFSNHTIQSD